MTGVLKAKVGGVWVPVVGSGMSAEVARWNSAWGQIAFTAGSDVDVTAGPSTIVTLPFTGVAGRNYAVRLTQNNTYVTAAAAGNTFTVEVKYDGTLGLGSMPVSVDVVNNYVSGATIIFPLSNPTSGAHTLTVVVTRNSGTGTMKARYGLAVEDVGPTAPTATPPIITPDAGAISHTVAPALGGTWTSPVDDATEWQGANIAVPSWAKTVFVTTSLHHCTCNTTDSRFKLRTRIAGVDGTAIRIAPNSTAGTISALTWTDAIAIISPGTSPRFSVVVGRLVGTGVLSGDPNTSLRWLCQFSPY